MEGTTATTLWKQVLEDIKHQTAQAIFNSHFAPTTAIRQNGSLIIQTDTEASRDWLQNRWQPLIQKVVARHTEEPLELEFALKPLYPPEEAIDQEELEHDQPALDAVSQAAEAIEDYLEKKVEPKYEINGRGEMTLTTFRTADGSVVPHKRTIAPFHCYITEKLTIYEEHDRRVLFTLKGQIGNRHFKAQVSSDDWADPKKLFSMLLRYLPGKPPSTDPAMRKYIGPAIAALTDAGKMKQTKAQAATGWTPDGKAYVMPTDSVGDSSYICQFDNSLAAEFAGFNLTPREPDQLATATNALLSLTHIYKPSVITTLIAHAFLPPLLRWIGDEARYVYHIHADTGSLKTELGKIIMALYGPIGTAGITYKWTNTPIGAEHRAHALKDCLFLIDDLKPGTINETDKQRWVAFVQAAVDALGRKRAAISGRASTALPPRALLLSTGEAIPEAGEASYTARMLMAELNRQPTDSNGLIIRNALLDEIKVQSIYFSGLMRGYIEWLLAGKGQGVEKIFAQIQRETRVSGHARLASNFAANRTAAVMFAQFLETAQLLTPEQAQSFLSVHHHGLTNIVKATARLAHEERYSLRFINGLRDALGTGFVKLSDTPCENRVGWEDDEFIYLLPGAKELVDQWLRAAGQPTINIAKGALRKQLFDDLFTHSVGLRLDQGHFDRQLKDPATNNRIFVLSVFREKFYGDEEST